MLTSGYIVKYLKKFTYTRKSKDWFNILFLYFKSVYPFKNVDFHLDERQIHTEGGWEVERERECMSD